MALKPATSEYLVITMLGSGNVATHLSVALEEAGHRVQTVYSRKKYNAASLVAKLKDAVATDVLDFDQQSKTDIYIVCLTDAVVPEVMQKARFPENSIVVHTAGSLSVAVLEKNAPIRAGVFYPIQTFSKNQPVNFQETPIAIEATHPAVANSLKKLASTISQHVFSLTSEERKQVHLAAVFACNFTNHLLGISQEILHKNQLPADLLKTLIQTTINKALENNPFTVQTGPAVRSDANILDQHLQRLKTDPIYQEIYRLLSESIQIKAAELAKSTENEAT